MCSTATQARGKTARVDCSVVIATYKRPQQLLRCLRSVDAQTVPPCEIVVVTQSDDETSREVASRFTGESHRDLVIRDVHIDEPSIVKAENAGIEASNGTIVAFIDDDAVAPPDWLDRILHHYEDHTVGACGGASRNWYPDGRPFGKRKPRMIGKVYWFGRLGGGLYDLDATVSRSRDVEFLSGGNMSFRRSLAVRLDENLISYWHHWELDLCLTVREMNYRVVFDPTIVVDHYPSASQGIVDEDHPLFPQRLFGQAHNEIYVLLKHSGIWLRLARFCYLLCVGSRAAPGAGLLVERIVRDPRRARQHWRRFVTAMRARVSGLRTWRSVAAASLGRRKRADG